MNLFVTLVYLSCAVILASAQNDGRYRPVNSVVTKKPVVASNGRYQPSNDGRYTPVNDGRYRPSDDGRYSHIGDKDRGLYSGGGGEYTGGGGEYTGSGGDYDGGFGKYTGGNGQNNAGSGGGIGSRVAVERYTTVRSTVKPAVKVTAPPTAKPIPNANALGNNGWKIIRDEKSEEIDGYHYLYETENGILSEESGRIENLAPEEDGLRSTGFYQYIGDDGVLYRVDYVADHNGFVAQGDHLPKTPPAIQKLLDNIASQPSS